MAICAWCRQEMTTARSCSMNVMHAGGHAVPMIPYGSEPSWPGGAERCGDCGARRGGFHHPGCDLQCCPLCHGQMLSCGCRFDEDDVDDHVLDDDVVHLCGVDPGSMGPGVPLGVDSSGFPMELVRMDDIDVIVHYGSVPESDLTEVSGIRCTTALRTLIDIAPDVGHDGTHENALDCLERKLFTLAEAHRRIDEPDMARHPGAAILREVLASLPPPAA